MCSDPSSWHVLWFLIGGLIHILFLSLVVNFQFFNSHVPVTTLGPDLFSGAYLNKIVLLQCSVIDSNSIQVVHQVTCFFCLKTKTRPAFETLCFFKNLENGQSPKKEEDLSHSPLKA
jgi:hypothetical protein